MNKTDTLLLTSLYQNCKTATQAIHDILPKIKNTQLLQELKNQYNNYLDFISTCLNYAKEQNTTLNDNNIIEKVKMWCSVNFSTIFNKDTRHLTEMLLIGTVMGTVQCYKDLHDHKNAKKELLELTNNLLEIQENNFNSLKTFLKNM